MKRIHDSKVSEIRELRRTGHSFPEIRKIMRCGYGTVIRYASHVEVDPQFKQVLREKQGGSKARASQRWTSAHRDAAGIGPVSERDLMFLLVGLYWGEGTKRELNIINGDPRLILAFVYIIRQMGIEDSAIAISLRVFESSDAKRATRFWAETLGVPSAAVTIGEVVPGSGVNKLPNGMCRVRIRRGERYFKRIIAMIDFVSNEIRSRSSMDRTAAS